MKHIKLKLFVVIVLATILSSITIASANVPYNSYDAATKVLTVTGGTNVTQADWDNMCAGKDIKYITFKTGGWGDVLRIRSNIHVTHPVVIDYLRVQNENTSKVRSLILDGGIIAKPGADANFNPTCNLYYYTGIEIAGDLSSTGVLNTLSMSSESYVSVGGTLTLDGKYSWSGDGTVRANNIVIKNTLETSGSSTLTPKKLQAAGDITINYNRKVYLNGTSKINLWPTIRIDNVVTGRDLKIRNDCNDLTFKSVKVGRDLIYTGLDNGENSYNFNPGNGGSVGRNFTAKNLSKNKVTYAVVNKVLKPTSTPLYTNAIVYVPHSIGGNLDIQDFSVRFGGDNPLTQSPTSANYTKYPCTIKGNATIKFTSMNHANPDTIKLRTVDGHVRVKGDLLIDASAFIKTENKEAYDRVSSNNGSFDVLGTVTLKGGLNPGGQYSLNFTPNSSFFHQGATFTKAYYQCTNAKVVGDVNINTNSTIILRHANGQWKTNDVFTPVIEGNVSVVNSTVSLYSEANTTTITGNFTGDRVTFNNNTNRCYIAGTFNLQGVGGTAASSAIVKGPVSILNATCGLSVTSTNEVTISNSNLKNISAAKLTLTNSNVGNITTSGECKILDTNCGNITTSGECKILDTICGNVTVNNGGQSLEITSTNMAAITTNSKAKMTASQYTTGTFRGVSYLYRVTSSGTTAFSVGARGSVIKNGTFTGSPAVDGKNYVEVKQGIFMDSGIKSKFLIADGSEATTVDSTIPGTPGTPGTRCHDCSGGGYVNRGSGSGPEPCMACGGRGSIGGTSGTPARPALVTTVKLSNPPVIIDWGSFPGINLDLDLAAPTISVSRDPKSLTAPTKQVTFTITASDPAKGTDEDGNPNPPGKAYISVNGDDWRESPVTVTITEPGPVTILARDDAGNVREFNTEVKNIDVEAPEILGFTQSSTAWTRNAVTVTVNAVDDVKLNNTPYRWIFTPNDGSGEVAGSWTSAKSFKATKNGKIVVEVRDASDAANPKVTRSEEYWVNNIDTTPPTATHVTDPLDSKVSKDAGVTVSVTVNDVMDPVTLDSSGISNLPIQWWQGATPNTPWTDELSKTFHSNETWHYRVKDALGNISPTYNVTINQISTTAPVITSLTGPFMNQAYVTAPTTLTVNAAAGEGTTLAPKPYSWDGGKTWTSINSLNVYQNGEYTVLVRDAIGNVTEASAIIPNIDSSEPTTNVYLYKGPPADNPSVTDPLDFVWKLKVEANDEGAGIDYIETLWDGGHHSTSPVMVDITEPGVYGVIVHDKAGNQTYIEKVITAEQLGEAYTGGTGSNQYVGITTPSDGTATAGEPFNAPLQDLVFGPNGAYNTKTGDFIPYPAGQKGITANFTVNGKRGTWLTGTGTFANQTQNVKFGDTKVEKIEGGRDIKASVFFPFQYDADGKMTWPGDVKNGRIKIVIKEWKDEACTQLNREGSATLYTSVQSSDPILTYSYDKATGQVTVIASSAVGGIDSITVDKGDGSGKQPLTGNPATFSVSGLPNGTTITIEATDNLGNKTTITKTVDNLGTSGSAGGSLSVSDLDDPANAGKFVGEGGNTPNSYHISNRAAEIYIINGTRSNTNSIPNVGGASTPAAPAPVPNPGP